MIFDMQPSFSTAKKIGVVYGFLVILVVIALGVRFWQGRNLKNSHTTSNITSNITSSKKIEKKASWTGKISLVSNATSFKIGDNVDLQVVFEAKGKKLDGADFVLLYNPKVLTAVGFSEGKTFNLYPRKDIDNKLGMVKVTALDSTSSVQFSAEKVSLGVLHMQAKSAGSATVSFDFSAGGTNKTTLIEQSTSQNILGVAEGITIKVSK